MLRLGYMCDAEGLRDRYAHDESTAGSAVRNMTPEQLERFASYVRNDDYLSEAWEEALERNLDYVLIHG